MLDPTTPHCKPLIRLPNAAIRQLGLLLGAIYCCSASLNDAAGSQTAAQDTPWGISLSYGEGARGQQHDAARLGLQRHWLTEFWQHRWGHFTGYWDLSVADFDASRLAASATDRGAARIWAMALAPVLRWQLHSIANTHIAPFMELGVGVSYLSDDKLRSGKQRSLPLGSHFQFEDRGVIGVQLGRQGRWEIAYQRIHYSNLNLANSNHGVDTQNLMLGYRF